MTAIPRVVRLWAPVATLMVLIFWLSSQSSLPAPPGGLDDKQAHAVVYGLLASLIVRALSGACWNGVTLARVSAAVLMAVAYGATDEWHQSFVAARSPELADLCADALGAAAAGALLWGCGIIAARRSPRRADVPR
jgi:VanZ family protein